MKNVRIASHAVKLAKIRTKLLKKVSWTAFRCIAYFSLVTVALLRMFCFDGKGEVESWIMLIVAMLFVFPLDLIPDIGGTPEGIFELLVYALLWMLIIALMMFVSVFTFLYQFGKLIVCWKRLKHVDSLGIGNT